MKKTILVGLGNPGTRFMRTRHNLGYRAVQAWLRTQPERQQQVIVYEPTVFMNDTGPAVAALLREYYANPADLIVVHDDVEINFGEIKVKEEGSANGHNGVRSIQDALGTQAFRRVRLGVGRPSDNQEMSDYVLAPFTPAEEQLLPAFLDQAAEVITRFLQQPDDMAHNA